MLILVSNSALVTMHVRLCGFASIRVLSPCVTGRLLFAFSRSHPLFSGGVPQPFDVYITRPSSNSLPLLFLLHILYIIAPARPGIHGTLRQSPVATSAIALYNEVCQIF